VSILRYMEPQILQPQEIMHGFITSFTFFRIRVL